LIRPQIYISPIKEREEKTHTLTIILSMMLIIKNIKINFYINFYILTKFFFKYS
jgi:hypothetical protein